MGRMRGLATRLRQMFWRSAAEDRMNDEMRFHIEMETQKHIALGCNAAEARRRALIAFGGVEKHREQLRSGRKVPLLEDGWQDVRFAARSLLRTPGFTLVAVLVLGVGIGAGVAMYSVLNGVLLQPLPVQRQDEVVVAWTQAPARGSDRLPFMYADLVAFGEATRTFDDIAGVAYQGTVEQVLVDAGRATPFGATWVTGNFFTLLGVAPVHGRLLLPEDDEPGAAPVMVISYGFWQRYFGGEPTAVGQTVQWNGGPVTVVGVLPRGFEYPPGAEAWTPVLPAFPATREAGASASEIMVFDLVGRLAPGATGQQARAELAAFLEAGDAARPAALRGMTPVLTPLPTLITGNVRATLWTAAAAVTLLLLIACVNVANLLLIRGSARAQELAVRSALGAGRRRLVRQLLTESGVLALLGGVLGVALAYAAVRLLVPLAPPDLPRAELVALDARALGFTLGITMVVVLLSGLLPAVLAATGRSSAGLRGGARTAGPDRGTTALRHALVVGQISLSILVVVSAGLLARSLAALHGADMGFNADRLLVVQTMLQPGALPERGMQVALQDEAIARILALPDVVAAASLPARPYSGQGGWTAMYTGEAQTAEEQATNPWVNFEVVGAGYFETLQVPLLRGRGFAAADREDAPRVAVVSEAVARHTWPGADPIGQRIKLGGRDGPGEWHTVIGVAGETRYRELTSAQPTLYLPARQFGGPVPMSLAVRTRTDPTPLLPRIRSALQQAHPDLLLVSGASMRQHLAAPLARPRFGTFVLGALAAVTLLLAAVGIYGALAATVRQRTRELGVRLALGARGSEVRGLVLRQGALLALAGCAIGIVAAYLATGALRSMLYGISPTDPLTYAAVTALILGAALLACYLPARRASRVDPVITLRSE
jgi:putative ABC transport system permease protein